MLSRDVRVRVRMAARAERTKSNSKTEPAEPNITNTVWSRCCLAHSLAHLPIHVRTCTDISSRTHSITPTHSITHARAHALCRTSARILPLIHGHIHALVRPIIHSPFTKGLQQSRALAGQLGEPSHTNQFRVVSRRKVRPAFSCDVEVSASRRLRCCLSRCQD